MRTTRRAAAMTWPLGDTRRQWRGVILSPAGGHIPSASSEQKTLDLRAWGRCEF